MYSICVRRQLPWVALEEIVAFSGFAELVELRLAALDVRVARSVAEAFALETLEMGTRIGSMNGELLGLEEAWDEVVVA